MNSTSQEPHKVYYVWHRDEGREGLLARSELEIILRTVRGRMAEAAFSTHIVSVSCMPLICMRASRR